MSTTIIDDHPRQMPTLILLYIVQDAVEAEPGDGTQSQGNSGELMPPPSTSSVKERPTKVIFHNMC